MAYRTALTTFLFAASLTACGPGSDETTSDASTTAATATTTGQTTTGATTGATTDPTTNPTTGQTTDQTTDPTTGQTTEATTGGATCPDTLPEEGTPCENEGLFCNSGCTNPCQFCNIVRCEGGTWQGMEAFPADCLDCDGVCGFVVPAQCVAGPPDTAACVAGCMDSMAGRCGDLFNEMLACIGSMPAVSCDAVDRPTVVGCDDRFTALYDCLGI